MDSIVSQVSFSDYMKIRDGFVADDTDNIAELFKLDARINLRGFKGE